MQGLIKPFSLAGIFSRIFTEKMTGELMLRHDLLMKQVFFERGQIVFALSNRPEDRFGEMLVRQGRISREQLNEALSSLRQGTRIGRHLVDCGLITERELLSYLTVQMAGIVKAVYEWKEGIYQFLEGDNRAPEDLKLKFSTQTLILEGIRAITDFDTIRAGIGDPGKYLAPVANRAKIQSIAFSPIELSILSMIKEPMDLLRVLVTSRDRPEKVLQAIYGLLAIGMLEQIEVTHAQKNELLDMKHRIESQNPFHILGISTNATLMDAYNAYNQLITKFHPEAHPEATPQERAELDHVFRAVTESYNYIRSNPAQSAPTQSLHSSGYPQQPTASLTVPQNYTPVSYAPPTPAPPPAFYVAPNLQQAPSKPLPQFLSNTKRDNITRAVSDEIDYKGDNKAGAVRMDVNRALKESLEYFDDKRAMLFAAEALSVLFRTTPPLNIDHRNLVEIIVNWARSKATVNNWPISLILVRVIGLIKQASDAGLLQSFDPEQFFPVFVRDLTSYLTQAEVDDLMRGLQNL